MHTSLWGKCFSQKLKQPSVLFLSISLLMPWHSFAIGLHPSETAQKKQQLEKQPQASVHNHEHTGQLNKKEKRHLVDAALGQLVCAQGQHSIIGKNEWQELQLDWLVERLDTTQTTFGHWALHQLLHPVADKYEIIQKQNIIKMFAQDKQLSGQIQNLLKRIARSEDSLIAYWDEAEYKESARLFSKTESFYFSLLKKISPSLAKSLNNSRLALEGNALMSMVNTGMSAFYLFGLYGLYQEYDDWVSERGDGILDPVRGIMRYFKFAYRALNPFPDLSIKKKRVKREDGKEYEEPVWDGSLRAYSNILLNGTAGDRFFVGSQWHTHKYKVNVPFMGEKKIWETERVKEQDPWVMKRAYNLVGLTEALVPALLLLKSLRDQGISLKERYTFLINTMHELQLHMIHVKNFLNALHELAAFVKQHESLSNSCIAQHLAQVLSSSKVSKKLERLMGLLNSNTFKSRASFVYSRGRVLLAHKLMQEIKGELVPALQAIGELDAYCALAQKCIAGDEGQPEYTFVEFIDDENPLLELDRCRIPVLDKPVENSITLGGNQPSKLVITGPNGGGKSTILKMLGHVVVLGQSFGIVPAAHARSTIFTSLRTCLHPEEDLMNSMSTFMAEKKRIDEIESFMSKRGLGHKTMLLLDEPFKGTVDAESAERIYQFGKKIANVPQSIVCIATHVKKPVSLEYDTRHAFANRHVEIAEHADGTFERLFSLRQGTAEWWFNDTAKRARYVDWLGTQYAIEA